MVHDYASSQHVSGDTCKERYVVGEGVPLDRRVPVPNSHLRRTSSAALRLYAVVVALLRFFVRTLYLFPVLLIPKIVLWWMGNSYGDLITLAFVVVVVALFAVLALTQLLFVVIGPPSTRHRREALLFEAPVAAGVDALVERALASSGALPSVMTRLVGRVEAGEEEGAPVLVDQWRRSEDGWVRTFEGQSFALLVDGKPPVIVELLGTPILVGTYAKGVAEPVARVCQPDTHDDAEAASRCVLRQGDRVELITLAPLTTGRLDNARLQKLVDAASPRGPYRASESAAVLARVTPEQPTILRVL